MQGRLHQPKGRDPIRHRGDRRRLCRHASHIQPVADRHQGAPPMTSNELGTHTVPPSPQVMGVTLSAETVIAMRDASCPNCQREFYAFTDGEYCPECWKAWGKADGSF